MFSGQHFIPKQSYRVDNHPTAEDLHRFLKTANTHRGIKHCFTWTEEISNRVQTLTIHFSKQGNDPEWWMHESTKLGPRLLWFYRSSDLSSIFSQILGNDFKHPTSTDREKNKRPTFLSLAAQTAPAQTPTETDPVKQSNKPPLHRLLGGSLEIRPFSSILTTAEKESATGRIVIQTNNDRGIVHFLNGLPVHAITNTNSGIEALLEIYTWSSGTTSFTSGTTHEETTIAIKVEQILYRGEHLLEDIGFLKENGIDEKSIILASNPAISPREFEKRILEGPPLGLDLQKLFFQNLDGQRTLQQIADFLSLQSSQWISITANMLRLGLLLTPTGHMIDFISQSQSFTGGNSMGGLGGPMVARPVISPGTASLHQEDAVSKAPYSSSAPTSDIPNLLNSGDKSAFNMPGIHSSAGGNQHIDDKHKDSSSESSGAFATSPFKVKLTNETNALDTGSPSVQAFVSSTTVGSSKLSEFIGLPRQTVQFEHRIAQYQRQKMKVKETNVFSTEIMHYFIEEEYRKAFACGASLALISFCMKPANPSRSECSSIEIVSMVLNAIDKIKAERGILGHFGEKSFMIILPAATTRDGVALVDSICTRITQFAPELKEKRPVLHFGIASCPADTRELDALVTASQHTMFKAITSNITRAQFERE